LLSFKFNLRGVNCEGLLFVFLTLMLVISSLFVGYAEGQGAENADNELSEDLAEFMPIVLFIAFLVWMFGIIIPSWYIVYRLYRWVKNKITKNPNAPKKDDIPYAFGFFVIFVVIVAILAANDVSYWVFVLAILAALLFSYTLYSLVRWFKGRHVRASGRRSWQDEDAARANYVWQQQEQERRRREYEQQQTYAKSGGRQGRGEYEQKQHEQHSWQQAQPSPFVILGVSEDATEEEVRKARNELNLRYHTDKHKNDHLYNERTAKIAEINWAHDEIVKIKGWKKRE
jgi:cell division protein FtsW (lipid II flippase)